tara:strand:- start:200 stop:364 length:165 start_codon:yes stop_codon:yes gene_type:complete
MTNIWYSIGDFFTAIFEFMPVIGNKLNNLYILIIFSFLVVWTIKMIKQKRNEEA